MLRFETYIVRSDCYAASVYYAVAYALNSETLQDAGGFANREMVSIVSDSFSATAPTIRKEFPETWIWDDVLLDRLVR